MIFLLLSIICSVTVGVLFKLAKRYEINITQAITWNYLFAMLFSVLFFKPDFGNITLAQFSPIYYALGILMPVIFIYLGLSVKKAGLARTDIAQRLSLFISLCAAYFLFKEEFTSLKFVGILFGFTAILLTMYRKSDVRDHRKSWIYLLLVFLGFGVVDILFKMVSQITIVSYTTSLFIIYAIAFTIAIIYLAYLTLLKNTKLQFINFVCGGVLGLFNFGNILFYLKAHRAMADNPSTVFAAMNIGVILAGTLIGVLIFKEKLSKWNYVGLVSALIAISLIALSKIYAV